MNERIGDLSHTFALYGYTGPRTTWANVKFVMNHAHSTGSIARPIDPAVQLASTELRIPPGL